MANNTEQIPFRTDEDTAKAIKKRAREKDLSMNEWLNRAVKASLAQKQGGKLVYTQTTTLEF